jgi:hypothetical protein
MSYGLVQATDVGREGRILAGNASYGNDSGYAATGGRPAGDTARSLNSPLDRVTHILFNPNKHICVVLEIAGDPA